MKLDTKTNMSDQIVQVLLSEIISDKMKPGDAMPSERSIMRELGIGRLSCREALAKLSGMGIIESHHGKGTFLTQLDSSSINPEILNLLQKHKHISNMDIIQTRLMIEPTAAAMATENASDTQRKQILDLVNGELHSLDKLSLVERANHFAKIDIHFHQTIAEISGNPLLPLLLKCVHELLLRVRLEALILKPDIAIRALADHKKIGTFIKQGDIENARTAMERHIRLRGKELLRD